MRRKSNIELLVSNSVSKDNVSDHTPQKKVVLVFGDLAFLAILDLFLQRRSLRGEEFLPASICLDAPALMKHTTRKFQMNLNQILTNFVFKLNANNPNGMTPAEQRYEIELLEQRIMFSATQFSEMLLHADVMIPDELPVEIFGNNGNNDIVGTELDDIINGRRGNDYLNGCLLYTSPSPRDQRGSRMPSSA